MGVGGGVGGVVLVVQWVLGAIGGALGVLALLAVGLALAFSRWLLGLRVVVAVVGWVGLVVGVVELPLWVCTSVVLVLALVLDAHSMGLWELSFRK